VALTFQTPIQDRLTLTIYEALRATGIGRTKFYEEVGAGRIKVVRVGRRVLVPVDGLRAWMKVLEETHLI
jgi:excisionase family DNA binding protein